MTHTTKIATLLALIYVTVITTGSVLATEGKERDLMYRSETILPSVTVSPSVRKDIKVALKKANALKEIDRRLESLARLIAKIKGIKNITDDQKETLIAKVQIEIAKLKALREQIIKETSFSAFQTQKKSITESYRIYGLFMPKIEIIVHADKIITIANNMAGRTSDQALLAKIEEAKTKANKAISTVIDLLPEEFPKNKADLQMARNLLREARTTLNEVYPILKNEK